MTPGFNDHGEELVCCFKKENLKYFHTGKIRDIIFPLEHSKAHDEKIPHIITRIFVKSPNGDYLVQKRAKTKKFHTGRWTDSASGHVRFNDKFEYEDIEKNAQRELFEEMGCKLQSIRFLRISVEELSDHDCELTYIFLGISDGKIQRDPEEVDIKSDYYPEEEMKQLLLLENNETEKPWVTITKNIWKKIVSGEMNDLFDDMQEEIEERKIKTDIDGIEKKKTGLVIGRFQPLHKGHVSLIIECLKYVKKLKIGIGSSQFHDVIENPFSYDERNLFIDLALSEENVHPLDYDIFPIPDKFDIYKWMKSIEKIIGNFDVIFTNNLWIGRLFQLKRKKLVYGLKFDFERYNGTKIRNMIFDKKPEWMELVPASVYRFIGDPEILKRLKKIARSRKK